MNRKPAPKFLALLVLGIMTVIGCSPAFTPAATLIAIPPRPSPATVTLSPSVSRHADSSPSPSASPAPSYLAVTAEPPPSMAPVTVVSQGNHGRIVFVSRLEGRQEVYSMNPDGSSRMCLTCGQKELRSCEGKVGPALSPDGNEVAFLCQKPMALTYPDVPYPDIYVLGLDSSQLTYLGSGYSFGWFPDSRRIVLNSISHKSIQVMQVDGTLISSWPTGGIYLNVSPDSDKITYVAEYDESQESLYVMNLKTGEETLLIEGVQDLRNPTWLMDSQRIVYLAAQASGTDVYVFDLATWKETVIARAADDRGAWLALSPDGSQIAFTCADNDRHGLCISNSDGSNRKPLPVVMDIPVQGLSWSPDGTRIVFLGVERIEQDLGVYVIAVDGTGLIRLAEGSGWGVAWGP